MDPLSISASVVGILTSAAAILSSLNAFCDSMKQAPKLARAFISEVSAIGACFSQINIFLATISAQQKARESLLLIDQVVVSLTETVYVFSEVERAVDSWKGARLDGLVDRVRWILKEKGYASLLSRLERSKLTLNLILTTLNW